MLVSGLTPRSPNHADQQLAVSPGRSVGPTMKRRDFIAYGSAAAMAAGLVGAMTGQTADAQTAATFELHLEEIQEEMIDGEVLFALAYRHPVTRLIRPTLQVVEGATVSLKLVNKTRKPRRFALTGFATDRFPIIPAGSSQTVVFTAPGAGSYIYHENAEGAVGRLVGLHGPLVVLPVNGRTARGTKTPYTDPTAAQAALFDALGASTRFPGEPWRHDVNERTFVWMFSSIDPALNRQVELNLAIDMAGLRSKFLPRYFTLNGLSGYDASHDLTTTPHGYEGEPVLIRSMNAGLATHSPHIHGNHIFTIADVDSGSLAVRKRTNIVECDSWALPPLWRKDVLLPFIKPDDIPDGAWPPREETFPLYYPMHCHMEMSQTAGGGNYPQGLITHWEMVGPRKAAK